MKPSQGMIMEMEKALHEFLKEILVDDIDFRLVITSERFEVIVEER